MFNISENESTRHFELKVSYWKWGRPAENAIVFGLNDSFVSAAEKQLKQGLECGGVLQLVTVIFWKLGK